MTLKSMLSWKNGGAFVALLIYQHMVDQWWLKVIDLKSPSGSPLYSNLSDLIKVLLVLPCDQAPVERVFSMVNKFHTKYSPTIQNSSVCALLTCKVNSKVPCPQMAVSNHLAKQVKSAVTHRNNYLKEQTKESHVHNA